LCLRGDLIIQLSANLRNGFNHKAIERCAKSRALIENSNKAIARAPVAPEHFGHSIEITIFVD
jgi:hypothetical protein